MPPKAAKRKRQSPAAPKIKPGIIIGNNGEQTPFDMVGARVMLVLRQTPAESSIEEISARLASSLGVPNSYIFSYVCKCMAEATEKDFYAHDTGAMIVNVSDSCMMQLIEDARNMLPSFTQLEEAVKIYHCHELLIAEERSELLQFQSALKLQKQKRRKQQKRARMQETVDYYDCEEQARQRQAVRCFHKLVHGEHQRAANRIMSRVARHPSVQLLLANVVGTPKRMRPSASTRRTRRKRSRPSHKVRFSKSTKHY